MAFDTPKKLFPNYPVRMRILFGPFRGARIVMNPRHSLRKMLGLYEHELNAWLKRALCRVDRIVDVGANDGYFTFGCAAALKRLGNANCEIIGMEPQDVHAAILHESIAAQGYTDVRFTIIQALVGSEVRDGATTLDALPVVNRQRTLIKIDVEGAELDVIRGATTWMDPTNLFLIEIHKESFLEELRELFAQRGHSMLRIDQKPLFLIGREQRSPNNWWLVSELK